MSRPGVVALQRRGGERMAELAGRATAPLTRRALLRVLPRIFRPEAAQGLNATFELRVPPTVLMLRVSDGALNVTEGPAEKAGATAEINAEDLVRMAAGVIGWPELLAARRLTLGGDPFLALRFPALFGLSAG